MDLVNPGTVEIGLHRDWQKTFNGKFLQHFYRILGRTLEKRGRLVMDRVVVKGHGSHETYLGEARRIE
jgi:hypothetical protein